MKNLIKNIISSTGILNIYTENYIKRQEKARFLNDAVKYLEANKIAGDEKDTLTKAYLADFKKYRYNFKEWFLQFKLYGADNQRKEEFISVSLAQKYYRSVMDPEVRTLFHDKRKFLKHFSPFVNRTIMEVNKSTPREEVINMIRGCKEVIVKPVSGSLGSGIFKIKSDEIDSDSFNEKLNLIYSTDSLIEQCISGCAELQKFHPQSLNTIRVVTVSDGNDHHVFGSFFRMGCGASVVDNAHAGGIYAHIDIDKGEIDSRGYNVAGESFEKHPDTGFKIEGTKIPLWEKIKSVCTDAHKTCSGFMVGWDVVVNDNNEIVFIEGHHAPDMDVMQDTVNKGLRASFEKYYNAFKSRKK